MILYRPHHLWQGDPNDDDPHGWVDCGSASMAMLTDAVSKGTVRPSIHDYRSLIKSEPEPDPKDPGVNNGQLLEAAVRFGLRVTNEVRLWRDFEASVIAHRAASLSVWTGDLGAYRSRNTGAIGHQLFVMARSTDGKKFLVFDPAEKAPRWVPIDVLRTAAETWGRMLDKAGKVLYLVSLDPIPYQ